MVVAVNLQYVNHVTLLSVHTASTQYLNQWRIQDFPEEGAPTPRGGGAPTYDFAKISQKLHEIERIWTPGGGARVPCAPLRSATVNSVYCKNQGSSGKKASLMRLQAWVGGLSLAARKKKTSCCTFFNSKAGVAPCDEHHMQTSKRTSTWACLWWHISLSLVDPMGWGSLGTRPPVLFLLFLCNFRLISGSFRLSFVTEWGGGGQFLGCITASFVKSWATLHSSDWMYYDPIMQVLDQPGEFFISDVILNHEPAREATSRRHI